MRIGGLFLLFALAAVYSPAQSRPRARQAGVPFDGTPGALNAITDVPGVEVGHKTLNSGRGKQAVRTGVTAVFPRGRNSVDPVFAGWFSQNGNGEMTGTTWVEESGFLESPVLITNTHSVGTVRDAYIGWQLSKKPEAGGWFLPVVAETFDGFLNDINHPHVQPDDVREALDAARGGSVAEGNTGGGTGMVCFGFKGGIGTASRKSGDYTVGVLVQCNCGRRPQLTIAGVPIGREIAGSVSYAANQPGIDEERGSIIIVIGTDAPLLPNQLKRLTRRATMGLARIGATSSNGSGDIFIAFSTANRDAAAPKGKRTIEMIPNDEMNSLFQSTVEAVEESIVNAMFAAETMIGFEDHKVEAIPTARVKEILRKYSR